MSAVFGPEALYPTLTVSWLGKTTSLSNHSKGVAAEIASAGLTTGAPGDGLVPGGVFASHVVAKLIEKFLEPLGTLKVCPLRAASQFGTVKRVEAATGVATPMDMTSATAIAMMVVLMVLRKSILLEAR
jgi:hypothetical protein